MAEYLEIAGRPVLFNPPEYSISTTAVYDQSNHRTEVVAVNRKVLELELFFDSTVDDGKDVTAGMDKIIPDMEAVEVLWGGRPIGSGDVKNWYISGYEKNVTRFSEDGVPIRGFLNLAFQQVERNRSKGSADGKRKNNPMQVELSWNDGKVTAVYNPASYRIYSEGIIAEGQTREQNLNTGKHHLELTLFFAADAYDDVGDLKKDTAQISELIAPLDSKRRNTGQILPEIRVDFGTAKPLKGLSTSKAVYAGKWYLIRLIEHYNRFDEAGVPLRASLDLAFVEA